MATTRRHYRLTHPEFDFWVTVHERDGRFMATADLAEGSWDVGVGGAPQQAARDALKALGEPHASNGSGKGSPSHRATRGRHWVCLQVCSATRTQVATIAARIASRATGEFGAASTPSRPSDA